MLIYHIVKPDDWAGFTGDTYTATSLHDEGFIHCSFEGQLPVVLERYYSGVERVVVLTVDTERLSSRLVNEPSTGGEIYPHIYGPINRGAIVGSEDLVLRSIQA